MKIKFPTGTTAENNQLLLPEGMLSIDIEKRALRLHDGVTQGGFEMLGIKAVVPVTEITLIEMTTAEESPATPNSVTLLELITAEREI